MKPITHRFPCRKWLAILLHLQQEEAHKPALPRVPKHKRHRHTAFLELP